MASGIQHGVWTDTPLSAFGDNDADLCVIAAVLRLCLHDVSGMPIALALGEVSMSLVKLLGFTTMGCGCVSGRYRDVGTNREVTYIEEKGATCGNPGHQRNQPVSADRVAHGFGSSGLRAS